MNTLILYRKISSGIGHEVLGNLMSIDYNRESGICRFSVPLDFFDFNDISTRINLICINVFKTIVLTRIYKRPIDLKEIEEKNF